MREETGVQGEKPSESDWDRLKLSPHTCSGKSVEPRSQRWKARLITTKPCWPSCFTLPFTYPLQVGEETKPDRIHCQCNHLTSFASDFLVAPNPIDFDKVFSADVGKNPAVIIAISLLFGLYFILVLIARRFDKKDLEKVRYWTGCLNRLSRCFLKSRSNSFSFPPIIEHKGFSLSDSVEKACAEETRIYLLENEQLTVGLKVLGPVSRKSRNFTHLFRV